MEIIYEVTNDEWLVCDLYVIVVGVLRSIEDCLLPRLSTKYLCIEACNSLTTFVGISKRKGVDELYIIFGSSFRI